MKDVLISLIVTIISQLCVVYFKTNARKSYINKDGGQELSTLIINTCYYYLCELITQRQSLKLSLEIKPENDDV